MIWDVHPRSGSGLFSHPGSRGQKNTGSESATLLETKGPVFFQYLQITEMQRPPYKSSDKYNENR
jgi:hypothetical protein